MISSTRILLLASLTIAATAATETLGSPSPPTLRNDASIEIPQSLDDRFVVELIAREPQVRTPTGIAVDSRGRIWVVENNTHFRPSEYEGAATDRVLILDDFGPDGQARRVTSFFDGFRDGMGIGLVNDRVYLATRADIRLLDDRDGDGRADSERTIVKLETPGNYPHNGLSGFAFDAAGNVYFGLGENLGAPYSLIGSDGTRVSGGGEGGSVYRSDVDGGHLTRIATGFWNPFHLAFDERGRLYTVDNDPDSRPPCRLIHIIQGGDYGYRFRNGRRGVHPFTAWNGELPGTLPMVAGTAEAPSGVLACDAVTLPEFRGDLLVTSWGDHVLQRFVLRPRGESVAGHAETLVKGTEDFRPVGIAAAPDGSIVLSDWVDKSYPVHGKGRIWRLRTKAIGEQSTARKPNNPVTPQLQIALPGSPREVLPLLADSDPFRVAGALEVIGREPHVPLLAAHVESTDARLRLGVLLALRRAGGETARKHLQQFLSDPDPSIRRAAIQWIGEERLTDFADAIVSAASQPPITRELFEAYLAAADLLAGTARKPTDEPPGEEFVARLAADSKANPTLRALALRMLPPEHATLKLETLDAMLETSEQSLHLEVVRTLAGRLDAQSQERLRHIAGSESLQAAVRAEATSGLALSASSSDATRKLLLQLSESGDDMIVREAWRSLRGSSNDPAVADQLRRISKQIDPAKDIERAEQLTLAAASQGAAILDADFIANAKQNGIGSVSDRDADRQGDAAAGERLFFHLRGPQCFACHRVNGRGGLAGPDLSFIGRTLNRTKLVESIAEPNKDIAPQYTTWQLATRQGKILTGIVLGEDALGEITLADSQGLLHRVAAADVEERMTQPTSIMPQQLLAQMTRQELADLIAFLETLR